MIMYFMVKSKVSIETFIRNTRDGLIEELARFLVESRLFEPETSFIAERAIGKFNELQSSKGFVVEFDDTIQYEFAPDITLDDLRKFYLAINADTREGAIAQAEMYLETASVQMRGVGRSHISHIRGFLDGAFEGGLKMATVINNGHMFDPSGDIDWLGIEKQMIQNQYPLKPHIQEAINAVKIIYFPDVA
jgi:hypothetical protein